MGSGLTGCGAKRDVEVTFVRFFEDCRHEFGAVSFTLVRRQNDESIEI